MQFAQHGPTSLQNLSDCTSLFSDIWQTESVEAKRILYYVVFTNALSPHILSYMWCLLSTLPPPPPPPPPQQQNHPVQSKRQSTGGSTQTEFFSVPFWTEAWHFFSYSSLFQYHSLTAARREVYTRERVGRNKGKGRKRRTGDSKRRIMDKRGRNTEWNVTFIRNRLNPVCVCVRCWNNSGILQESTQDGGQSSLSGDETKKTNNENHLKSSPTISGDKLQT